MKSFIFPLLAACMLLFSGISYTVEAQMRYEADSNTKLIWTKGESKPQGIENLCAAGCPIYHVASGKCTQKECEDLCEAYVKNNQFSKCLHEVDPQYDNSDCCCSYGAKSC
ncbi:hypothetical protein M5689_018101 [Euphorbia peplus]|nr:hypothetical protein M5689_018101 [Euphorbia peplus]